MYKTIAMGLYYRFKKEDKKEVELSNQTLTSNFIKNSPYEFEYFVADILEGIYGGTTYVTESSGDYGVDIEHQRSKGLFLVQVKCYKEDVSFDPIAIIHSQIVKQNASGGIVLTTSGFTSNAQKYAKEVDVELIDGLQLVHFWSLYLQKQAHELGHPSNDTNDNNRDLKPA
ncbi:restriction endonuclease [Paenibacillus qinlingensis]|uniref:Restriction system protein n=1 Tax=Paenibacillus qinlingensis TaxID=1837343 RepID=A0ABU1NNK5_9BACL|nr:restriction endonuclease [Paenibacillus qinlingensis]MDR6549053.1 restriction system protein [Paenibacillus qinlingensis]